MAAAATGVAALTTAAVSAYADYEQLVGGVETLFGTGGQSLEEYAKSVGKTVSEVKGEYESLAKAEKTVLDNADKAYKTAGMSANEYMETVTSFSASLIQGLGGDTEKAAQIADKAIVDMSDNANKMGTSMELIQNAYQGFAKQNYTMLDNLKLGYGGTQAEMARLINDSGVLGDTMEVTAKTVNEVSFDKIIEAIHVIQTEMGITGTTAKEASETIAGSASAMKASWKNLVTGFGNENANLTELVEQFAESVVTYGKNLIPRIGVIAKSIGTVIITEVPKLLNEIPVMVGDILPELSNSFTSVFKDALGGVFSDGFLSQMEWNFEIAFPNLAGHLESSIIENFSGSLERLGSTFEKVGGIIQPFIETCLMVLINNIQTTMTYVTDVAVPALGFLFDAFMDIVDAILSYIVPALENIRLEFETLYLIVQEAINDYIIPILSRFIDMLKQLWEENQDKINKIGQLFGVIFNNIAEKIEWFVGIIEEYLYPLFIWLVEFVQEHMDDIQAIFQSVFDIIGGYVDFFIALFTGDWEGMWEAITSILQSRWELIQNIFTLLWGFIAEIAASIGEALLGVWEGIQEKWQSFCEFVGTFVQSIQETLLRAWETIILFFTESIPQFIAYIVEWISTLPETIAYWLGYVIGTFIRWGEDLINWAVTNIPVFVENIIIFISELPGKIAEFLSEIIARVIAWAGDMLVKGQKAGSDFVSKVVEYIKTLPGKIKEFIDQIIREATSFATNMGNKAAEAGKGFFDRIVQALSELPNKMAEIGSNIVSGIWSGISAGWDWLIGKVQDLANSLFQGAKDALDINSPSGKFMWLAEMCVAGWDEGMEPLMDPTTMTRNIKASYASMQSGLSGQASGGDSGKGGFNQTIIIQREISTADEMARAIKVESKYGLMRGVPVG